MGWVDGVNATELKQSALDLAVLAAPNDAHLNEILLSCGSNKISQHIGNQ